VASGGADWVASPGQDKKPKESPIALARLCERRGQPEQAERFYQAIIEKEPQNPLPYHRLAVMRARAGRFPEANEYFDKALALGQPNATLLSDAGYNLYLQGRAEEAEKLLRQAVELKPRDASTCNNLAILLSEKGAYGESLALFRRAGNEAQAHASLAFMLAQQGELEQARTHYSRALSLDPNLRPAAEAMVQLAGYEKMQQELAAQQGNPGVQQAPAAVARSSPTARPEHPSARPERAPVRAEPAVESIVAGPARATRRGAQAERVEQTVLLSDGGEDQMAVASDETPARVPPPERPARMPQAPKASASSSQGDVWQGLSRMVSDQSGFSQ